MPPYQGDRSAVLARQVKEAPPSLGLVASDVPDWFDSLVAELLQKDPHRRPGVHQVIRRLEEGEGRSLSTPELWPLDVDGKILREGKELSNMPVQVAGVAAVAVLGGAILVAVLLAAFVTIVLVLGLP